jgi:tetratricopeptide (TPR) repeat protein
MQGLLLLYKYQGRLAEWARLVNEIISDYCTANNELIPGREDAYGVVLGYRVMLAREYERDLPKALTLQEKRVKFCRYRAAIELTLNADTLLDNLQQYRLCSLAVSVFDLGQILMEKGSARCIKHYQEAIYIAHRIADKTRESIVEYNIARAYIELPIIRNLDAAEAASCRGFSLCSPNDALYRSGFVFQIGTVHYERFLDAKRNKEPKETQIRHLKAAERYYLQGLQLCPKDAFNNLAPIHGQLGNIYSEIGQFYIARRHYELAAQYAEMAGDHFNAGLTRLNIALTYAQTSQIQMGISEQRDLLLQAQAYATAALRDFQHYQGRAAKDEAKVKDLLNRISQDLAKLPS